MMSDSSGKHGRAPNLVNRIPVGALVVVALLLILGTAVGAFALAKQGQTAQNEKATTENQLQTANSKVEAGSQLAEENLKLCMDPSVVETLQQNGYQRVCDLAIVIQTQSEPGKPGERGPGPTQAQINQAVEEWFNTHPLPEGKSPTIEQVITAVGEYLRLYPPAAGRPPTAEEIAVAAANYLAEHSEEFRGPQGKDGLPGPPPTADAVRAAVAAYCGENDNCRGAQGPQGISITGVRLDRDGQQICTLYFIWENPATTASGEFAVQVRDEMCPPASTLPTIGRR